MQLAELNVGRLVAETGDPRVADFMNNLDRINNMGRRMPGFVWMMEGSGTPGTGNTDAKIDGDPLYVANLSVWNSVEALGRFVWDTVHSQFYDRRTEWFEVARAPHFVMWWVPEGHRPSLDEALARLEVLRRDGDTPDAFGWAYAKAHPQPPVEPAEGEIGQVLPTPTP